MHEDHRQRMRDRCMKSGFEGFSDHELIEMLLGYSIPRKDTNPIAHELIDRFGSLGRVLEAEVDELVQVDGMGERSAIILPLVMNLMRRYAMEKDDLNDHNRFETVSSIAQYFCRIFFGLDKEFVYVMLLDNRMNMVHCQQVGEGTVNSSNVNIREIVEKVIAKKASTVVLAHNHPHGIVIPSNIDVDFTEELNHLLAALSIHLLEHLIIVEDRFYPIMREHYGTFRCSPLLGKIDSGFYDHFYDVDAENWTAPKTFKE